MQKFLKIGNLLLLPFIIFLYAPVGNLYKNSEIFIFDIQILVIILFCSISLFIFSSVVMNLIIKDKKTIFIIVSSLNFYLITNLIINNLYNEKNLTILLIIDILVIFFSFFLTIKFKNFFRKFFFILFIILLNSFLFETYKVYKKNIKQFESEKIANKNIASDRTIYPNVYHFILDAYQYHVFKKLLENKSLTIPSEFKILKNFYSEFITTELSLSHLFDTQNYKKLDYSESELLKKIKEKNIDISIYSKTGAAPSITTIDKNIWDIQKMEMISNNSIFSVSLIIIDNTFLSISPQTIQAYISSKYPYNPKKGSYGFSFTDYFFTKIKINQYINFKKYPKIIDWPYWSSKMMEEVQNDEVKRKSNGNYIYAHLTIPHGPFVLDKNGKYKTDQFKKYNSYKKYEEQAQYSIKMMNNFIDELKKQKKYNNSLIIINSDHGFIFSKEDIINNRITNRLNENNDSTLKLGDIENLDEYLESWSRGLLLVKLPEDSKIVLPENDYYQLRSIKNIITATILKDKMSKLDNVYSILSNDELNRKFFKKANMNNKTNEWLLDEKIITLEEIYERKHQLLKD